MITTTQLSNCTMIHTKLPNGVQVCEFIEQNISEFEHENAEEIQFVLQDKEMKNSNKCRVLFSLGLQKNQIADMMNIPYPTVFAATKNL